MNAMTDRIDDSYHFHVIRRALDEIDTGGPALTLEQAWNQRVHDLVNDWLRETIVRAADGRIDLHVGPAPVIVVTVVTLELGLLLRAADET